VTKKKMKARDEIRKRNSYEIEREIVMNQKRKHGERKICYLGLQI